LSPDVFKKAKKQKRKKTMINSANISNVPPRKQASPYDENLLKTFH